MAQLRVARAAASSARAQDTLDHPLIGRYLDADRDAASIAPYALTPRAADLLSARGIPIDPHPTLTHAHPACKTIENYFLQVVIPPRLTGPTTVYCSKRHKSRAIANACRQPIIHAPTALTAADLARYPDAATHAPISASTPLAYIDEALQFMTPLDVATIFDRSPALHTVFALLIAPPEILTRSPSAYPSLYRLDYHGADCVFTPDDDYDGAYVQPLAPSVFWLRTRRVLGPRDVLTVEFLDSRFGHHLVMITRRPCEAPSLRTFGTPDVVLLPDVLRPAPANHDRAIPRKLASLIGLYIRSVRTLTEAQLTTRVRSYVADGRFDVAETALLNTVTVYLAIHRAGPISPAHTHLYNAPFAFLAYLLFPSALKCTLTLADFARAAVHLHLTTAREARAPTPLIDHHLSIADRHSLFLDGRLTPASLPSVGRALVALLTGPPKLAPPADPNAPAADGEEDVGGARHSPRRPATLIGGLFAATTLGLGLATLAGARRVVISIGSATARIDLPPLALPSLDPAAVAHFARAATAAARAQLASAAITLPPLLSAAARSSALAGVVVLPAAWTLHRTLWARSPTTYRPLALALARLIDRHLLTPLLSPFHALARALVPAAVRQLALRIRVLRNPRLQYDPVMAAAAPAAAVSPDHDAPRPPPDPTAPAETAAPHAPPSLPAARPDDRRRRPPPALDAATAAPPRFVDAPLAARPTAPRHAPATRSSSGHASVANVDFAPPLDDALSEVHSLAASQTSSDATDADRGRRRTRSPPDSPRPRPTPSRSPRSRPISHSPPATSAAAPAPEPPHPPRPGHAAVACADLLAELRLRLSSDAGRCELAAQRWPPPGAPTHWPADWPAAQLAAVLRTDRRHVCCFNIDPARIATHLVLTDRTVHAVSAAPRLAPTAAAAITAVRLDPLRDNLSPALALPPATHFIIAASTPSHARVGLELAAMARRAAKICPQALITLLVPGYTPGLTAFLAAARAAGAHVRVTKPPVYAPCRTAHVVHITALDPAAAPAEATDTPYELAVHAIAAAALAACNAPDAAADAQVAALDAARPAWAPEPVDAGGAIPPLPAHNTCLLEAVAAAAGAPVTAVWAALLAGASPLRRHTLLHTADMMSTTDLATIAAELRLRVHVLPTGRWLHADRDFGPPDGQPCTISHRPGHWFVNAKPPTLILPSLLPDFTARATRVAGGARHYPLSPHRARPYLRALRNTDAPAGTLHHRHLDFLEALATKVSHAHQLPRRSLTVGGVMGLPGSGKSRDLITAIRKHIHASDYRPGSVTIVAPREALMRSIEAALAPPPNVIDVVHTFELALIRPAAALVLFDDAGLLPPGYLDVYCYAHPEVRTVLFTGDTLQGRYTSRCPAHGFARMAPEILHLSRWANSYRMTTDRLAVGVAAALGLATTSTRAGTIKITSRSRPGLPTITAKTNAAQTLNELGVDAYTGGTCQGQTFKTAYQFIIDEHCCAMSTETLFTCLTRGERDVYVVCLPARRHSFLGRNAFLDALLSEDGLAHQVALLVASNVPQHLLALDRGGASDLPTDKLAALPHLHATIDDAPRALAPTPAHALPEAAPDTRLPLTVHPVSHAAHAAAVLDSLPPREYRELYVARLACLTEQFPEELDASALFPVHRTKDAATVEASFAKRVKLRATTLPPDLTAADHKLGHELFVALIGALNTPATQIDQATLDRYRHENDDAHLAKPLQELINNARRSEPSWPREKIELSMKNQAVTKLESLAGPAKAGQTIACFRAEDVLEFGPYGRFMLDHVLRHAPPNVHIHCRASTADMQDWVARHWDFSKESTEDDCVALDQSLRGQFLVCEALFMAHHGISDEVIERYMRKKLAAYCFLGALELMRFSGEWSTFLFNTTAVIAHKHLKYRIQPGTPQMYAGDDSAINATLTVRPTWAALAAGFLLKTKPQVRRQPVFCGWRLTPAGLIKDPKLSYYRLLFALARSAGDDGLRSYFLEHLYTLRAGPALLDNLDPDLTDYISATNALFAAAAARRPRLKAALQSLKTQHLSNTARLPDTNRQNRSLTWTTCTTSTPNSSSLPTPSWPAAANSPRTTSAPRSTPGSPVTRAPAAAPPPTRRPSTPRSRSTAASPPSSGRSPRTGPAPPSPRMTSQSASSTTSRPRSPQALTAAPTAIRPPRSLPATTRSSGRSVTPCTRSSRRRTARSASGPAATPRPSCAAPAPTATSSGSVNATASPRLPGTSASTSPTVSTPRASAATSSASYAARAKAGCSTRPPAPPTSPTASPSPSPAAASPERFTSLSFTSLLR